jgi:hypothetical protein
MSMDIEGEELTCFEVAEDGSSFRMHLEDKAGRPASLSLPTECLNRLMMTLPGMVTRAVQRQHNDRSLRIVYPVDRLVIELGSDLRTRILTLETPDGFNVSFSLSEAQCNEIGGTESQATEIRRKVARAH